MAHVQEINSDVREHDDGPRTVRGKRPMAAALLLEHEYLDRLIVLP